MPRSMTCGTDLWNLSHPFAESPFNFEETISGLEFCIWLQSNWTTSLYFIVVYLLVLASLRRWMDGRKRFELRRLLALWNIGLAVFPSVGAIRLIPEFFRILNEDNRFHNSICDLRTNVTPVYGFWAFLFAWSKITEFGDTFLILLRKRPLTFLHVYLHCTVLFLCFYTEGDGAPTTRWFSTMNYFVHSIMYSYYALQILKFMTIPKAVAVAITTLQILQMIAGIIVNWYGYKVKTDGVHCDLSYGSIYAAGMVYFSYFLLFLWFFYNAYILRGKKVEKAD